MNNVSIPWNRYALIAYLSEQLKHLRQQVGKTVLQKIIYILQEGCGVPCDYNFTLYSYGPYCADIHSDLDFVSTVRGVNVNYVLSGFGGFSISPGSESEKIKEKGIDFLSSHKDKIDRCTQTFGSFSARDLELRSTIIYCERSQEAPSFKIDELVAMVAELKPHFSDFEIRRVALDLAEKGFISIVVNKDHS